jgi:hypothetical protein
VNDAQLAEGQRADMFRDFHAEHLRRQTKAIETIRAVVVTWFILMIVGTLIVVVAASQSSGY